MKLYDRLVGQHRKEADAILKHKETILDGTFISIDPASKDMGYALFTGGELIENGTAEGRGLIGPRLYQIMNNLPEVNVALVIVEKVRMGTGHAYLTWSTAIPIAKYGTHVCEVSTRAWKKNVDDTYEKSDERDALEIGKFAVTLCKEDEDDRGSL